MEDTPEASVVGPPSPRERVDVTTGAASEWRCVGGTGVSTDATLQAVVSMLVCMVGVLCYVIIRYV